MSMARLVITAVTLEGRSKTAVAADYGVSRRWVQKILQRYVTEGEAAFEPRSRRPRSSPNKISVALEDEIVELRKFLAEEGPMPGLDDRLPPRRAPWRRSLAVDDLARPLVSGLCRPRAPQAAEELDHQVLCRPAE